MSSVRAIQAHPACFITRSLFTSVTIPEGDRNGFSINPEKMHSSKPPLRDSRGSRMPRDSNSDDPDFEAASGPAGSDDSNRKSRMSGASLLVLPRKRKASETEEPAREKRTRRERRTTAGNSGCCNSSGLKGLMRNRIFRNRKDYEPTACAPDRWDRSMPREILLKIFRHAVDEVGVLPFLETMSKVCSAWKSVAQDVSLWEKVDMCVVKANVAQMNKWSKSGVLKRARELDVSSFGPKLTHSTIVNLVKNGPRLEILNLSYNTRLMPKSIKFVINNCENLRGIDISGTNWYPNALKLLFTKRGSHLVQLYMAELRVSAVSLSTVLNSISSHLPRLEVLDFSNITTTCDVVVFPLEKIQETCPELRVLRLANTQMRLAAVSPMEQARSPGFRKLEELSVNKARYLNSAGLRRILKSSEKLTLLDVGSCKLLSVFGLVKIPARDLTHLYLDHCSAAYKPTVKRIMKKWSHSLRVISMCGVSEEADINAALQAVATNSDLPSQLNEIHIRSSSVSFETLKLVLQKCVRLKTLDLTGCRGLPRDIRRLLDGTAVPTLRARVNAGKFD